MRDRDQPQPASAGQHPFPLNQAARADRRKMYGILAVLGAVLSMHCASQLAGLVDEAEEDCGRARALGHAEGHAARKHRHGP